MKKKIIIITLLVLIFSAAAGLIYLNNVYLPVKLKAYLTERLESLSGYNAKIGSLNYHLLKGLVIKDIIVYDQTADARNTILTAKEVSFNLFFLPLLKEQKIIIPLIKIRYPSLHIRYNQDGTFNFSKIFAPKPEAENKQKRGLSFFIYRLSIIRGKCILEDEHFTPVFSKNIIDLNMGFAFGPSPKASFVMQGNISHPDGTFGRLSVKGNYRIAAKEMNLQLNLANLPFEEFEPCLKNLPFAINSGNIDSAVLELNLKDKILKLQGAVSAKNVRLAKNELILSGNINIAPFFNYTLDKKEFDYTLIFNLLGVDLEGIKYINKIKGASGELKLTKNSLSCEKIQLETLGSAFRLKGSLDFNTPYLKMRFDSSEVDLATAFALLSPPADLKLTGTAAVGVDVEGNLDIAPLDKKAVFQLNNAVFRASLLKEPLNNISGKLILSENGAEWPQLIFNYRNIAYNSSGKLANFKEPHLSFSIGSKDLDLKSDLAIKDKDIKINTLEGKYFNSRFNLAGDIDTRERNNPLFNLGAKLNLQIADALAILPDKISAGLKKTKLAGNLNIEGSVSGAAKNYPDWKINAKASSDLISVYDLKFSNLSFDLDQQQGLLLILNFVTSSPYSGIINLAFSASLKKDSPTYLIKFGANGIDLQKLKADVGLKNADMSGTVYIDANLNGEFKNISTLKGLGFISVKDGKLWQINLFKGLGELFLLPEYQKIIFHNAQGEFEIENNSISTDNLKLESEQLILDCAGNINFDGSLNFTIYSTANKGLIRESADIRKFFAAIVGELSGAVAIKLTGTVKNPKFGFIPMPLDLIKNIKNFILGK